MPFFCRHLLQMVLPFACEQLLACREWLLLYRHQPTKRKKCVEHLQASKPRYIRHPQQTVRRSLNQLSDLSCTHREVGCELLCVLCCILFLLGRELTSAPVNRDRFPAPPPSAPTELVPFRHAYGHPLEPWGVRCMLPQFLQLPSSLSRHAPGSIVPCMAHHDHLPQQWLGVRVL